MTTKGRTKTERQRNSLRRLEATQRRINQAVADHHTAFVECVSQGCSQSQIAATLQVSRQAVSEYVKRWMRTGEVTKPLSGPILFD